MKSALKSSNAKVKFELRILKFLRKYFVQMLIKVPARLESTCDGSVLDDFPPNVKVLILFVKKDRLVYF